MRVPRGIALALVIGLSGSMAVAEELKSGLDKKTGGPFHVKAITGDNKGKQLCYVCKYNAESRPAVVLIFSQKADENLASLVKAVDEVQKSNAKLGTVVVGVSGVEAADLEKLQETHKLTTPLTVAVDKDGPKAYKLNKDAAVTVLVYKKGGEHHQELRVQGHQELPPRPRRTLPPPRRRLSSNVRRLITMTIRRAGQEWSGPMALSVPPCSHFLYECYPCSDVAHYLSLLSLTMIALVAIASRRRRPHSPSTPGTSRPTRRSSSTTTSSTSARRARATTSAPTGRRSPIPSSWTPAPT